LVSVEVLLAVKTRLGFEQVSTVLPETEKVSGAGLFTLKDVEVEHPVTSTTTTE
jgi:hypothetical protein